MNVLLDTCAMIWLANQDAQLSATARDAIEQAWFAHVSPISAWELGLKIAKGRISLPEPLETWWSRVIDTHQLSEFPLYGADAARSTRLPPIHNDPADRFLIAIAMEQQFTLLTPDPKIRQYPNLKTLWQLMQNLEQIRAANALEPAKNLDRAAVNKLPAMVLANGLLATAAFCDAEGGGDNRKDMKKAMNATAAHLAKRGLIATGINTAKDLIQDLSLRDPHHLQRATSEALAFIAYLKRFAPKKD